MGALFGVVSDPRRLSPGTDVDAALAADIAAYPTGGPAPPGDERGPVGSASTADHPPGCRGAWQDSRAPPPPPGAWPPATAWQDGGAPPPPPAPPAWSQAPPWQAASGWQGAASWPVPPTWPPPTAYGQQAPAPSVSSLPAGGPAGPTVRTANDPAVAGPSHRRDIGLDDGQRQSRGQRRRRTRSTSSEDARRTHEAHDASSDSDNEGRKRRRRRQHEEPSASSSEDDTGEDARSVMRDAPTVTRARPAPAALRLPPLRAEAARRLKKRKRFVSVTEATDPTDRTVRSQAGYVARVAAIMCHLVHYFPALGFQAVLYLAWLVDRSRGRPLEYVQQADARGRQAMALHPRDLLTHQDFDLLLHGIDGGGGPSPAPHRVGLGVSQQACWRFRRGECRTPCPDGRIHAPTAPEAGRGTRIAGHMPPPGFARHMRRQ